jgi:hypothetical protein
LRGGLGDGAGGGALEAAQNEQFARGAFDAFELGALTTLAAATPGGGASRSACESV